MSRGVRKTVVDEAVDPVESNRFEVAFAELHNPLFLAGCNLGTKLDPSKKTMPPLKLVWDDYKDRLIVSYNGKACFVPESGVANCHPKDPKDIGVSFDLPYVAPASRVTTSGAPMVANVSRTAQVETPHSRPPEAPGLPKKFQS